MTLNFKIILIIFCTFLPLFLLLSSYQVILLFNNSNFTSTQKETFNFLENKHLENKHLENKPLALNYTSLEITHLQDVRKVMKWADHLFYFSLLVCSSIIIFIIFYKKDLVQMKKLLFYGGMTTLIFLGTILLLALFNFEFLFTMFHQLFFPQGNWTFSADSLLIKTFPELFFRKISVEIFGLTVVEGIVLIIIGKKLFN